MPVFAVTVFISAFLLFQIQPIIAHYILPWFGGTATVWSVCMLFFQVMLLAGYAYAHLIRITLSLRHQLMLHTILLLLALTLLPITPDPNMVPVERAPALSILILLLLTIGLPFWLISASGPLFQHWFNRCYPGRSPYRLYALSNVGSLLALLSYPFVVEPTMALDTQTLGWSISFVVFVAGAMACAWLTLNTARSPAQTTSGMVHLDPPQMSDSSLWLLLSFCGSVLLLASTNHISMDVAVVPFLWVLPLSLYLLSFILCFDSPQWYQRALWLPIFLATLGLGIYTLKLGTDSGIIFQIAVFSALLFSGCMVSHGELVRIRPHPERLTAFYLHIATGGALGGVFVTVLAPMWYDDYRELPLVWLFIVLVVGYNLFREIRFSGRRQELVAKISGVVAALLLILVVNINIGDRGRHILAIDRNFYGVLRVQEYPMDAEQDLDFRTLLHGRITHGGQIHGDPEKRRISTTYYGENSGIGIAINAMRRQQGDLKLGAVGLGIGTIAALGRDGDRLQFYEINPQVLALAREYFTYLDDTPAEWGVKLGDARISLEKETHSDYDVLAIDAFSSGAIPVHLMTLEAFDIYLDRLGENGVLAVHISNRHLDLSPVVYAAAAVHDLDAVTIINPVQDDIRVYSSTWILLSRKLPMLDIGERIRNEEIELERYSGELVRWTDHYSNLLSVLTW